MRDLLVQGGKIMHTRGRGKERPKILQASATTMDYSQPKTAKENRQTYLVCNQSCSKKST